ncbi:zona pellucida-like domain protein [Dictyocaulus viviparus]|uniref:Zona pellucida-like domain protein n=1 Tax=Dictyocaulus viviparus TaxID=29172 RepID=A0A0D8XWV3_DICVI|nr:zona pellucida-like domain protein [Dictyocaulus viviparus]
MDVFLTFAKEFYGGVFTEEGIGDQRCRWRGHGQRTMVIRFSFVNDSECGLSTNESGGEYSMKLIVSPIDGLLVDGFTTIGVRCIYSTHDVTLTLPPGLNGLSALQINGHEHDDGVITGNGVAPLLSMQILDGHGINGMPLTKASIGQRITLDLVLKNTVIYDFYVYSCTANDGTNNPDASINVVDSNGCAVRLSRAIDIPIFATEPYNHGPKHIFLHMYGFQFTSSQFVHFECRVKPCVRSCHRQQCAADVVKTPLVLALRRRREEAERNGSLDTLRMQTVLQIEAQQTQTAALVSSQEKLDVDKMLPACLLILGVITSLIVLFCLRSSTIKLQMAEDKSI